MPIEKAIPNNISFQLPNFTCRTYGKCILAGEHAVLRGSPAVVVPIKSRYLQFDYWQTDDRAKFYFEGSDIIPSKMKIDAFFEYICEYIKIPTPTIKGIFRFNFHIPIASGMGTSACIAVSMAQWCLNQGFIESKNLFECAHAFENFFHGTSSGVDVAAVLHAKSIIYQKEKDVINLQPNWHPYLYLSYTGQKSNTSSAVAKAIIAQDAYLQKGFNIDEMMIQSVHQVIQALSMEPAEGYDLLKQAFYQAQSCYDHWELANSALIKNHMNCLLGQGASALKLTGCGDGGYMLSLWEKPPLDMPFEMIRVFE